MDFSLSDTLAVLSTTPEALDALLQPLPESWTQANEGGSTWSAQDVVAHLAYLEHADWMPRVHIVLENDAEKPFPPVDREGFRRESAGKSLGQLLEEFRQRRAESLRALRSLDLQEEQFARVARHPAFGTVTLSQLLATWALHDLDHLHQVSRILAHQYRTAVGPWSAYLGVLRCEGHGGK